VEGGTDALRLIARARVRTTRGRRRDAEPAAPLPPVADGHFREVKAGVLLRPAELLTRVWAQLREAGWLGSQTTVVVIGDGSELIWQRAPLFVRRCEILDFWHAMEYAWAYARLQFGEGGRRADTWTRRIAHDLKAGQVQAVFAGCRRCGRSRPRAASPWTR
jgi:hypothetical protein